LFQIIIPNIIFVFTLAILTAYLTFLSTKGSLTNNTYSGIWKILTKRGKIVLFVLTTILITLVLQELNNQFINKNRDADLHQEIGKRTSIINEGIRHGIDSISKQNSKLKKTVETLNLNSEQQKVKIIELYKQNTDLAIQLSKSSKKLSLPLPNELKVIGLSFIIQSEGLKKFLPEIRNTLLHKDKKGVWFHSDSEMGMQLRDGQYNKELQNIFDEKRLVIKLSMGDEMYFGENAYKSNFGWSFETKMSLKNNNSNFFYYFNKLKKEEYFRLSLRNASLGKPEQSSGISIANGLSSAADLCDKKVWIFIVAGGNGTSNGDTEFRAPIISISNLTVRDNNNKDYEIEIDGFKTYDLYWDDSFMKRASQNENFENPIPVTYVSGIFKCKSF